MIRVTAVMTWCKVGVTVYELELCNRCHDKALHTLTSRP